ncbi:MAG: hypothetical protein JXP34_17100 [Planctomycetes bacterium]|nr:hypothetical protein [Planctomycetota bacterium]
MKLDELLRILSEPAAIGARERAMWMRAAGIGARARARRAPALALAGAAAVALIAVAAIWLSPGGNTTPAVPPAEVRVSLLADEIRIRNDEIRADLAALSDELDALAREAALLDERREIAQLLDRGGKP